MICAHAIPHYTGSFAEMHPLLKKKLLNESNREEQWAITGCSRQGHYSIFSCAILL